MDNNLRRRMVGTTQLAAAVVDGVALSTIVLHATIDLDLPAAVVGVILAAGAAAAMVSATPLGVLADRLGLGRALALFATLGAAALVGYACATSLEALAAAAIGFAVSQSGAAAVRHALAVSMAAPADRLAIRATMHMLLNVGMGVGTVIGAMLAAAGLGLPARCAYGAGAVVLGLTALLALTLPAPPMTRRRTAVDVGAFAAWRDRRFASTVGLASVIQLTMPVLSVILPLWLVERTVAPTWLPAAALAVNTVLVIAAQRFAAARVTTAHAAVRAAMIAGGTVTAAGVLLAISAEVHDAVPLIVVVTAAITALTTAEICGGLVTWRVALDTVPPGAEGRYQAAFATSTGAARLMGPSLALPLVMAWGAIGWLLLAVAIAFACIAVGILAHPRRRTETEQPGIAEGDGSPTVQARACH